MRRFQIEDRVYVRSPDGIAALLGSPMFHFGPKEVREALAPSCSYWKVLVPLPFVALPMWLEPTKIFEFDHVKEAFCAVCDCPLKGACRVVIEWMHPDQLPVIDMAESRLYVRLACQTCVSPKDPTVPVFLPFILINNNDVATVIRNSLANDARHIQFCPPKAKCYICETDNDIREEGFLCTSPECESVLNFFKEHTPTLYADFPKLGIPINDQMQALLSKVKLRVNRWLCWTLCAGPDCEEQADPEKFICTKCEALAYCSRTCKKAHASNHSCRAWTRVWDHDNMSRQYHQKKNQSKKTRLGQSQYMALQNWSIRKKIPPTNHV